MKFRKKVFVLLLILFGIFGMVWGVREIGERREKGGAGGPEGQEITEKLIKFAVMSDIHSDWENFRKALQKAKNEGTEFVIVAGDLTTVGKESELLEAKRILDESGLKYYAVPGNHDVWWGRKFKDDIWGEVFGNSFQSFKDDGIKFILVNNGDGENGAIGIIGEIGGIREKQEDWLKKEAEECLRIYCLVFMHMPLNHPSSLHIMGEENPAVASEAAELVKLFVKNQVREIFVGHLHFSSSYELNGLKTIVIGAVSAERNFQSPKFLTIKIQNSDLEKKEVFLR